LQKLSGAVFCIQIRRSAKIKRSGFLHTPNSGKTDGIVSNQWRIGIIGNHKNMEIYSPMAGWEIFVFDLSPVLFCIVKQKGEIP